MMARRGILGLLAGGTSMLLGGCGMFGGNSYRFKMTVEVETPQGIKSGSAVMEIRAERGQRIGDRSGNSSLLRGEAIIVNLPSGPIFALLRGCDGCGSLQGAVTDALLHHQPGGARVGDFIDDVNALGGWFGHAKAELPREKWPIFVRFLNINNPLSIETVNPESIMVVKITLETTNERISTGIENTFPDWFRQISDNGGRLDGDISIAVKSNPAILAGQFSTGDFSSIYRSQKNGQ